MGTGKTSVEIDEDLLEAAKRILETTTVRDTVEEAFREVARVEARRREVETLTRMTGLDLADPDVMAGAWRS
jgi:Arc/MetJ family transcription regulator